VVPRSVIEEFDARARQLPTGDREDVDQEDAYLAASLREDDPRFDGKAARAAAKDGDLGPIVLPSAADAHRVLGELAALYHERFEASARHERLKAETKAAAEVVANLSDRIAERIRVATHRTGLPLFGELEVGGDE
jgi:hypothetical protein